MKLVQKIILVSVIVWIALTTQVNASVLPDQKIKADFDALFKGKKVSIVTPFNDEFVSAANKYKLPEILLKAVGRGESFFDQHAFSNKGAIGVMQIMPALAEDYNLSVEQLKNPSINIDTGARYLSELYKHFGNSPYHAVGGYFCGPGGVKEDGTLSNECDDYVRYIHSHLVNLIGQRSSTNAPSSKNRITIGVYNYFLQAEHYVGWLKTQLPDYQFDIFRNISWKEDYFTYHYKILASGAGHNEICLQLKIVTGFESCEENI